MAVLLLVLLVQGLYNAVVSHNVLGVQADLTKKVLLEVTNRERANKDIPLLTLNAQLNKAAQAKVDDMFAHQYWAHVAPNGTTPWYWLEQAGYRYVSAGENLAKNFSTGEGVVAAWMVSPAHRANVLEGAYRDVGFAIKTGELKGETTTLVVALYGTPDTSMVQGIANGDLKAPEVGLPLSPLAHFGVILKALSPVTIASIVMLLFATNVALAAHVYRNKLPKQLQRSWYRHHGLYKAVFLLFIATVLTVAYSHVGEI